MTLQVALWMGLLGAIGMFFGDMFLYYSRKDYKSGDNLQSIIRIMQELTPLRLYIGGILGPITAFFYCLGFYHIVLITHSAHGLWAWAAFFINCLGIICGSVYHAYVADLGLISRHSKEGLDEVLQYLAFQRKICFPIMGVGLLLIGLFILLGWTILPPWMVVFSPLVLVFLHPLLSKLPKGWHMIINGGWTNLIYVIYYSALMMWLF